MPPSNWTWTDSDETFARRLRDRLPGRVFDAHAHPYRLADIRHAPDYVLSTGPAEAGYETWRQSVTRLVGDRAVEGALFIAFPPSLEGDVAASNQFAIEQARLGPKSRALLVVRPEDELSVERLLPAPTVAGFKPYHFYSGREATFEAPLLSFCPEWVWRKAHDRGLVITLHIVKSRALADEDNRRTIRAMALKYPNARIVLAHAARGFNPEHTIEGLDALAGLGNVWFDTSAICEARAIVEILRRFGPRRVMWGTDFPISDLRGKCVSAADGFVWLYADTIDWDGIRPVVQPVTVGLEALHATLEAADLFNLNEEDLQDVFADNALRLLGLDGEEKGTGQALYRHARKRIPGGTQLLSKRPEMFLPEQWPAYFREARGCEVWDLDGRRYYDMSISGVGTCLFGYADPDVTRAVLRRVSLGSMTTLNSPEEVDLADLLCEMHPWAENVRFARTGGEGMAAAVRIARATTDRSLIVLCGYHGWSDWYLAANLGDDDSLRGHLLPGLAPLGVPRELRGTTLTFPMNDRDRLAEIMAQYDDRVAAVVMEPCRNADPDAGFLEFVRDTAHQHGALWILDEITIGFRLACGGAHLKFGVQPDIAAFAKAISSGYPMAAVIGTREAMSGAHDSFISSSYWTEGVGPTAAVATLRKMMETDVPAHLDRIGRLAMQCWRDLGEKYGLSVKVSGFPCLAHFEFDYELKNEMRTLFTQWMLDRGFLAGVSLYVTMAHTEEILARYANAVDEVFGMIADALATDRVRESLRGPTAHSHFARLN